MSNWDYLDSELKGLDLGREAGEWAVTAMACMAFADGSADERELEKARELVARVSVIRDSLGPAFGEQLFHDTIERLRVSPAQEIEYLKNELRDLAALIKTQDHRDHAFQTLLAIATADHEIKASEYKLMLELRDLIGSQLMVPLPQVNV